jgi:preprotein translocase subunit SecE
MNKPEVQTLGSRGDGVLVGLAALVALLGAAGFTFWSEQPLALRFGILLGGMGLGLLIAWFSEPGKRMIAFGREAWDEARRVVWPSGKETTQTTGVVFVFVALMSILLFFIDKVIEWGLYDVFLGWKK